MISALRRVKSLRGEILLRNVKYAYGILWCQLRDD